MLAHTELLLEQVAIRAEDVLAVAAQNRWPARELRRLLGYLRVEVLRQAEDEEMLLFASLGASAGRGRLGRDHARLREAIEALERAAAGDGTWSSAWLATVIRDLVCQLERHLAAEERLLAAGGVPGQAQAVTGLGGHPHELVSAHRRTGDRPGRASPRPGDRCGHGPAAAAAPREQWSSLRP